MTTKQYITLAKLIAANHSDHATAVAEFHGLQLEDVFDLPTAEYDALESEFSEACKSFKDLTTDTPLPATFAGFPVPATPDEFALQMTLGAIVYLESIQKQAFEQAKAMQANYSVDYLPYAMAAWLMCHVRLQKQEKPAFAADKIDEYLLIVNEMEAEQVVPMAAFFTNAVTARLAVTA